MNITVMDLKKRLINYPGAHAGEEWKNDTDLNHCTEREKEEIKKLGLTLADFYGFTRGEIHHMLFGYKYAKWTNTTKAGISGN